MEHRCLRRYVAVDAEFDPDGHMLPRTLTWSDGRKYTIDRVLDVRPAAAQKAGGQGDRYIVSIRGQRRYLFFERPARLSDAAPDTAVGRWFVEAPAPRDL